MYSKIMKILWNHRSTRLGTELWKKVFRSSCFLIFLPILLLSCKKDEKGRVPDVAVDIYININKPDHSDLQTTGGWVYLTGGSKGIIVYRRSSNEFKAYDRHCTHRPSKDCGRAHVDSSDIKIHCRPCSGSEYSIMDGSVLKGPATQPLKSYGTSFDGDVLHIYN